MSLCFRYENAPNNIETCIPSCPGNCLNGRCVAPGECSCRIGYNLADNGTCIPQCQNECVNGYCVAPDLCECNPGYTMDYYTQKCYEDPNFSDTYRDQQNSRFGTNVPGVNNPNANNYASTTYRPNQQFGTFRPPTQYQDHTTEGYQRGQRPYQPHSVQSTENPLRGQSQPGQRLPGSQVNIEDRFRDSNYHQNNNYNNNGQYEIYGSHPTDEPQEVLGLDGVSHRQSTQRPIDPHRNYDDHQQSRPYQQSQRPFQSSSQDQAQNQRPNPYNLDGNQTHQRKPPTAQGFFPALNSGADQRPVNVGNSRSSYDPNYPNQSQEPPRTISQTQRPQITTSSYGSNQRFDSTTGFPRTSIYSYSTPRPEEPTTPYRPGQSRNPYGGHQEYSQTVKPSGVVSLGRTQDPRRPYQQPQNPYDNQDSSQAAVGNVNPQSIDPRQNTPGIYPRPYQHEQNTQSSYGQGESVHNQGLYKTASPYGGQRIGDTSNQNKPLSSQGHYITRDGSYIPVNGQSAEGIKGGNQRPGTTQIYGTPALVQTPDGFPQVSVLAFEMHEIVPGESEFHDPSLNPLYNSPFNQFGPMCTIPCINGDCVGMNKCACKQGYTHDPRHQFVHLCIPVCQGGCLNGVCTAPNLCLCNAGFIKEGGIKGSQRCVPIF